MDLQSYRHSAETFLTELTGEEYRHFAGLKDSYEIEPIYERHAELFLPGATVELRALTEAASPGTEQQRQLALMLDFAVQGCIGEATKQLEAELARREASLALEIAGERIGFRESSVIQANEPDAERRAEIEAARLETTATQLNDLYTELIGTQHEIARRLGYESYRELCARTKGIDLASLNRQTTEFIARSDATYRAAIEQPLRAALGYGLDDLRRADVPRFLRAPELDSQFPAERLVESFVHTLQGLGIDLREQPGVMFDLEPRPNKSPRAFCAPARVPEEIYLVLSPVGGHDDFSVLFHEGGHTEHYANVAAEEPFEFRMLGDNAVTEAFAFLFQHLVENPQWLARRLDGVDTDAVAAHGRAARVIYLRRYAAKFAYELELHDAPESLAPLEARYSELLGSALWIDWPGHSYLADVDPGFYSSCYLRAWALEAHLRRHLERRFGETWFEAPGAGELLRGLWREGQRQTPDELLAALSGEQLDFMVLVEDLRL